MIATNAPGLYSPPVTACALEIAAAIDHVFYTYSWISGSVTNAQGYEISTTESSEITECYLYTLRPL